MSIGVYIKGMEMPKSCADCPVGGPLCCPLMPGVPALWAEYTNAVRQKRMHSDCPLVPVPPHYDLIDHNALKIAVMDCDAETSFDFLKHAMDCINKAPVIIPSDMPTYETEEGE